MYRIGDFSKITNITVKTLRYYDEQGILTPSQRAGNGYRFYDEGDFQRANLVLFLRNLDFGIAEIKDVLANCDDEGDISYFLKAKKSMIEQRVSKDKALIRKIEGFIEPGKIAQIPEYKTAVRNFEPLRVAYIRYRGAYQDTGKYLGKIYRELNGQGQGTPFNCYYDSGYLEEAEIEVCVPAKQSISSGSIKTKVLPGIKAVCTLHRGSYDFLNYAYKSVLDYAAKNNIALGLPSREIYHKGPGLIFMGNPNKFLTEIAVPCGE